MKLYYSNLPIEPCGEAQPMSFNNDVIALDGLKNTFDIVTNNWVEMNEPQKFEMSCDMAATEMGLGHIVDNKYLRWDIIVTDNEGGRYNLKDCDIKSKPCILRRIPRKMKKMLKKKWGDMWIHYHPNLGVKYEVKGKGIVEKIVD